MLPCPTFYMCAWHLSSGPLAAQQALNSLYFTQGLSLHLEAANLTKLADQQAVGMIFTSPAQGLQMYTVTPALLHEDQAQPLMPCVKYFAK